MTDYNKQRLDERWKKRSEEIKQRDNYTCQLCGKRGINVHVHHIKYVKGLDYWDYPDDLLMTVCPVCHAKIHGKYKEGVTENIRRYKRFSTKQFIFYRELLKDKRLATSDKLIYSYLILKAIKHINKHFQLTQKNLYNKLIEYFDIKGNKSSEHIDVSIKELMKHISLSKEQCRRSMKKLIDLGFVVKGHSSYTVSLFKDIVTTYGFDVDVKKFKPTSIIIFYHYLKHKSKYFNGTIDTWNSKIAEEYNTSLSNVKMMISRLSKEGLVERTEDNKLKIN